MLGPAHRFETRLLARGAMAPGVLRGDLILAGGGDPELDTDDLAPLVEAARRAGLARVTGRFLVDGDGLVTAPEIDPAQPVEAAYNPGVSALNLNFNRVRLRWSEARGSDALSVTAEADELDPPLELVSVERADNGGADFAHRLAGPRETWRIAGRTLRGAGARWLPVKRPALHAGDAFRAVAAARGLALPPPERGSVPDEASLVARVESRPLQAILGDMLRFSTNLTAEAVGVAASRAAGAEPASLAGSAGLMAGWLGRLMPPDAAGAPPVFANHSGRTAESRITPRAVVGFLRAAARRPIREGAPHPRLPGPLAPLLERVAGATGDAAAAAGAELRAKSGTMDYIRALAGYAVTPGGRRLAFAIVSNDLDRRDGVRRRIDRAWMGRARALERAVLRLWMRTLSQG
jgi:D-alanyl-D-alanine carboxypeptidase/D-alanyl-D-alanine-endopeptidase (penicillin-binding protein 4)